MIQVVAGKVAKKVAGKVAKKVAGKVAKKVGRAAAGKAKKGIKANPSQSWYVAASHRAFGIEGQRIYTGTERGAKMAAARIAKAAGHGWQPVVKEAETSLENPANPGTRIVVAPLRVVLDAAEVRSLEDGKWPSDAMVRKILSQADKRRGWDHVEAVDKGGRHLFDLIP